MTARFASVAALTAVCLLSAQASAYDLLSVSDYPVTTGYVIQDYPSEGTPLLSWFDFTYVFSDHHLRQAFVMPISDDIHLSYMDDSGTDTIGYSVGHYDVSGVPWESVSGSCAEVACRVSLPDKPADSEFVLVGFAVWFKNGDHHLRQLTIGESDGTLTVWLGDKLYDDPVGFKVDYSWVPQSRIVSQGYWGDGGTETIWAPDGEIPDGQIVLQGFTASYIDLDHHVTRLAVYPEEVSLYDKNRDDAIRGSVRWVELATSRWPFEPIDPGFDPVFDAGR